SAARRLTFFIFALLRRTVFFEVRCATYHGRGALLHWPQQTRWASPCQAPASGVPYNASQVEAGHRPIRGALARQRQRQAGGVEVLLACPQRYAALRYGDVTGDVTL